MRGRLLRVSASCPGCGARPALRVSDELARVAEVVEPDAVLLTYQCQRRTCGQVYPVTAGACRSGA